MKKGKPNPSANRSIRGFAAGIGVLFLGIALYLAYFLTAESETVINNSYNSRISAMEERMIRGSILADDGTVLARTVVATDSNGTEMETREYLYGELFAHAVGYSSAGKTGVEALANFQLLRAHGNFLENGLKELAGEKKTGDSVVTTLNLRLQQIAYEALGDRRGAVAAMDPSTGKILCMVSKPAFDPNTVAENWESLIHGDTAEARLLNRVTQGLYPPGSTFKILTALQYMREHPGAYKEYRFDCSGIFAYESYQIRCYHQNAHGEQDFTQAFANSCNGAFANLGLSLDLAGLKGLAEQLLFNRELPLSLPYSKSSYQMDSGAGDWEILQTSIGQGQTLISPMHNLLIMSAIANDGVLMRPYLIDRVENASGELVKEFRPSEAAELMVPNEAAALQELLIQVVNEGTGSALKRDTYQAAGKTGSAEFETGKETHAWFVGYAPAEDPKIAVCVIVEEGGSGGGTAAPIAAELMDAWLLGE